MQIKLFKKEKSFKKESSRLDINPYWKLAVLFVFITTIAAVFYGYYLFIQINKELVVSPGESSGQFEIIKKERIQKVLDYFSVREQKSNQILNSPSGVIDPSL